MKIMKIALVAALWLFVFGLTAQQPLSLTDQQMKYVLREKIRSPYWQDVLRYMQDHNGQLPPAGTFGASQEPTGETSALRSEEIVVHDDEKAESELHAAINPTDTNHWIVAPILQDPNNFLSPIDIPIYYTADFGQSWNTSQIEFNPDPTAGFTAGGGDPVLAFDNNGRAYISWLALTLGLTQPPLKLTLYLSTSDDQGQSWSAPAPIAVGTGNIDLGTGALTGSLVDKQWMVVDQSTGPFSGNLYVSYTELNQVSATEGNARILVKTLPAGSGSFGNAVQVHTTGDYIFMQFSSIDVDPEGKVHVSFVATEPNGQVGLYHCMSDDGGQTFSPEIKVSHLYYPPGNGGTLAEGIAGIDDARLYPCPHIRAGKTPGSLYLTWTANGIDSPEENAYDIYFSRSSDYGASWSIPVSVNASANPESAQFYNAITVNPDGVICLAYYDRADNPMTAYTAHVVALSYNGGDDFTSPIYASGELSDFSQIGALNGNFGIGEYTQIIATQHHAIPVWSDGRNNNGDIDIYAAIIPMGDPVAGIQAGGNISDQFAVIPRSGEPGHLNFDIWMRVPGAVEWALFDAAGRLMDQKHLPLAKEGNTSFSSKVASGLYFLQVETPFGWKTVKISAH